MGAGQSQEGHTPSCFDFALPLLFLLASLKRCVSPRAPALPACCCCRRPRKPRQISLPAAFSRRPAAFPRRPNAFSRRPDILQTSGSDPAALDTRPQSLDAHSHSPDHPITAHCSLLSLSRGLLLARALFSLLLGCGRSKEHSCRSTSTRLDSPLRIFISLAAFAPHPFAAAPLLLPRPGLLFPTRRTRLFDGRPHPRRVNQAGKQA